MTNRSNNAASAWRGSCLLALTGHWGGLWGGEKRGLRGLPAYKGQEERQDNAGRAGAGRWGGTAGRKRDPRSGMEARGRGWWWWWGKCGPSLQSEGHVPPPRHAKGPPHTAPKARDTRLPFTALGKERRPPQCRSEKKHPFGGFLGERGAFLPLFFSLAFFFFFWFFFLPLPPRSPAPLSLHCAGAQPCGPRCAAEPQHGSTVLSCLSDHPHSPFAIQLFAELNYEPAFFQKPDRSGKARGCSPAAAPVPPPTPRGSVTAACKVGRVPFRSLQRDCGSPRRFLG